MSKYALLIGCNYPNVPGATLCGCINDIVNMYNVLTTKMGYLPANIVMLRDDATDPALQPTKSNIITQLISIIQKSANAKEVWFHYSGHGSKVVDRSGDEISGYDSCIVPTDFMRSGFIIDDDLFTLFNMFKCPTMILSDSCFSGTVCDLPYSIEHLYGNLFRFTRNNRFAMTNPKVVMISGSKDSQTSADIYDQQHQAFEGAFTDAFLRTLAANSYKGGLSTIYVGTCNWLQTNGYTQKPLLSSSAATPSWTFGGTNVVTRSVLEVPPPTQSLMQSPRSPGFKRPVIAMTFH